MAYTPSSRFGELADKRPHQYPESPGNFPPGGERLLLLKNARRDSQQGHEVPVTVKERLNSTRITHPGASAIYVPSGSEIFFAGGKSDHCRRILPWERVSRQSSFRCHHPPQS